MPDEDDDEKLTPAEEAVIEAANQVSTEWNEAMRQQARRLYGSGSDRPRDDESLLDWMQGTKQVKK